MDLTVEQLAVVDAFADVYSRRRRRLTLGGFAGTGKTTVIRAIVDRYPEVVVCTPTGKAAHVLRSKGVEACTMHSLIYKPVLTKKGLDFAVRFIPEKFRAAIVDEASMLNKRMVDDFTAKVQAVFFVGDHGQLEPVGDDPGLMLNPDFKLEQIHRQANTSPIVPFAHHVRQGHEPRSFGETARVQYSGSKDLAHFDVVLCGYNDTRVKVNAWVRKQRGYGGKLPEVGEQIICLRNDKDWLVWNGMMGTVTVIDPQAHRLSVDTDDGPRHDVPFDPAQFGQAKTIVVPYEKASRNRPPQATLWDFGYCLTGHKSQGSQWPRVAVKEEIAPTWSAARWRYTAATRASEELRWVL